MQVVGELRVVADQPALRETLRKIVAEFVAVRARDDRADADAAACDQDRAKFGLPGRESDFFQRRVIRSSGDGRLRRFLDGAQFHVSRSFCSMIAKLRSAEAWLTPFLALKCEIEALFTARCVAIARMAAIQLKRVSAVAPRWKSAPDAMGGRR